MTAADLLLQVRYAINDLGKIEYSDDELLHYLNQAQDYIVNTAVNKGYKGLLKTATLNLINDSAQLPDDFIKEAVVIANGKKLKPVPTGKQYDENTYQIVGNLIYSKNAQVNLIYFYFPDLYKNLDDKISLPRTFWNLLKEITVYLSLNRNEFNTNFETQLSVLYEQKINDVISNYGFSDIPLNLPFRV